MFCRNCGQELPDGTKFCKYCGASQGQPAADNNAAPQGQPGYTGAQQNNFGGADNGSFGQVLKVVAAVVGILYAWFFISNFFSGFFGILSIPFKMMNNYYYYSGSPFGSLFAYIITLLQAVTFGAVAITCYLIFKEYTEDKQKMFTQALCSLSIVALALAVIDLISYFISIMSFIDYVEVSTIIFLIIRLVIFAIIPFCAYAIVLVAFNKKIVLFDQGADIKAELKNTFSYILGEFTSDLNKAQDKLDERSKTAELNGKPLSTDYSLLKFILLGIITLGIYELYVLYCVARDVNKTCDGDGDKTTGLLLFIIFSILTLGIYAWVYYYKLGNRLQRNGARYGLQIQENGTTVLLWMIFGSLLCGIGQYVAWHIILKNTNALNGAYNYYKFGMPMSGAAAQAQPMQPMGQPMQQAQYMGQPMGQPMQQAAPQQPVAPQAPVQEAAPQTEAPAQDAPAQDAPQNPEN